MKYFMKWLSLSFPTIFSRNYLFRKSMFSSLFGLLLLTSFFSFNAMSHEHSIKIPHAKTMAESVNITNAWARATFALAKTGAAYFTLSNKGDTPLLLKAVSISPQIAMTAELHHTIIQDEMMQMQELSDGVKIKSGEKLEFSPGGKHVMLMGLTGPLNKGETLVISLHFEDGSQFDQTFVILDKRNRSK